MATRASTTEFYGSPVRIPALGEYDLNPFSVKVAECILAAGSTLGVGGATSDTDADIMIDTSTDAPLFNIELDSDQAGILGVWVKSVHAVVVTAWTATVTMKLGDTTNTEGWGSTAAINCTSTGVGMVLASDQSTDLPYFSAGGVFYNSTAGEIEVAAATGVPAVGRVAVYAAYFRCGHPGGS